MRMGKTFDIWAFLSVFMLICNIYVFVKFKEKETVVTKVLYYIGTVPCIRVRVDYQRDYRGE